MKVYIGPYTDRCSIYHLEKWLLEKRHKKPYYLIKDDEMSSFDRSSEKFFEAVQGVLNKTINKYYYDKKKRKIKVHIDNYDVWGADHTLAIIIHPILIRLKDLKRGAPHVDDEDVPEELRSTSAPPKEDEYDTDANHFLRWDYVLNEMIYAFECEKDEDWENQFHSGNIDHVWVESGSYEGEKTYEIENGPNHTHVFDKESFDKAMKRRQNGLRLFAKYYHSLWD